MPFEIALSGYPSHVVDVARHGGRATVTIDGRDHAGSLRSAGDGYELTLEDRNEPLWIHVDRDTIWVHAFGLAWELAVVDPVETARLGLDHGNVSLAPMPGTVVAVHVAPGQAVQAGEPLVVIESMKMESVIAAPRAGTVERLHVTVGDTFDRSAPLVSLAPGEESA